MPSYYNPFTEARKRYKLRLLQLIQKAEYISIDQLMAMFSLETGLKRATVKDYLKELIETGLLDEYLNANGELIIQRDAEERKPAAKRTHARSTKSSKHRKAARKRHRRK